MVRREELAAEVGGAVVVIVVVVGERWRWIRWKRGDEGMSWSYAWWRVITDSSCLTRVREWEWERVGWDGNASGYSDDSSTLYSTLLYCQLYSQLTHSGRELKILGSTGSLSTWGSTTTPIPSLSLSLIYSSSLCPLMPAKFSLSSTVNEHLRNIIKDGIARDVSHDIIRSTEVSGS